MMEQCKAPAGHARGDAPADIALISLESTFIGYFQEGQAQERRRITREIHDSTMQLLSCLSLALARLKHPHESSQSVEIIAEMENLLDEAQSELRTLAYLANPPSLEALGLHDALQILVDGFGRRSGLNAILRWDGDLAPADHATEIALYRVVQESLSNVHRHARAAHVTVEVTNGPDFTEATIRDDGLGVPLQPAYGVGLSGMRARLDEIGGCLTVRPMSPGTEVFAAVPTQGLRHRPSSDSRAKFLELCANCHRTAKKADPGTAAALSEMATEFGAIADCLIDTETDDHRSAAPFIPALPLRSDHNSV